MTWWQVLIGAFAGGVAIMVTWQAVYRRPLYVCGRCQHHAADCACVNLQGELNDLAYGWTLDEDTETCGRELMSVLEEYFD